jgi:hypothetical protein
MYKTIVASSVKRSCRRLSEGDVERGVIDGMADSFEFRFIGDPHLPTAGVAHSKDALRKIFGRVTALLPGLQLNPKTIVVSGWPWNATVMAWVELRGRTASGEQYANDLLQIMTIKFRPLRRRVSGRLQRCRRGARMRCRPRRSLLPGQCHTPLTGPTRGAD